MYEQEQELIARGAECVAGDLILGRTTVGQYRLGRFSITAEGRDELENVVIAEIKPSKPAKTEKPPRAVKGAKAEIEKPALAEDPTGDDAIHPMDLDALLDD